MSEKFDSNETNRLIRMVVTIVVIVVLLALVVMTVWGMLDLVLLTFIITFLFYHFQKFVQTGLMGKLGARVPNGLILFVLYILVLGLIAILSISFIPKLVIQITEIANVFINFDFNSVRDSFDPRLADLLSEIDINSYISRAGNILIDSVAKISVFSLHILFAFLLSFMILLEKDKISAFAETMKTSKIAFIHKYIIQFGGSFVNTFGKVMKVQVIISFVNSILSMIMLAIFGFPSIMGLGIMIFLLGLIPVAGVIISMIPLCLIGFTVGGFKMVVAVIIMIIVIHGMEAYILNPKLMSNRTSLPICFVFIILLVAEHYLGVWGLLIGVPLFIFLMASFEVDYQEACKPKPILNPNRFKRFRNKNQ